MTNYIFLKQNLQLSRALALLCPLFHINDMINAINVWFSIWEDRAYMRHHNFNTNITYIISQFWICLDML